MVIIMILIVCVDDNNGIMFNKRRQSRDRILIERIEKMSDGKRLWMSEYSKPLFSREVCADDDFLDKAAENEYCFNETKGKIETPPQRLIVYKWNRVYPSDVKFSCDMSDMDLISVYEFVGSSHDKITEEIYEHRR